MIAEIDVKQMRKRLEKMLQALMPTMDKLMKEVPGAGDEDLDGDLEDMERPPVVDLTLKDMHTAAAEFRTGEEPTGDATRLIPMANYASPVEWAEAVLPLLSLEHQADCTAVAMKEEDKQPCGDCKSGGCRQCVLWRCVRYCRNIETGGKNLEGYSNAAASLATLKRRIGSQLGLSA